MNKKSINKRLNKICSDWLDSITDIGLKIYLKDKVIITGGCFVSMLNNEKVNDYDIYLTEKEAVLKLAKYYVDKQYKHNETNVCESDKGIVSLYFNKNNNKFEKDPESEEKYVPLFFSSNAITLSDKIQIVLRFYGNAEEIHKNYDFIHTTNYWSSKDNNVVLNLNAVMAIINKQLVYQGSKYPIASIIRLRKFIKRGWYIDAGQIVKMCFQLNDLDLYDMEVLKDQLIGVDMLYFISFLNEIKQIKDKGDKLDSTVIIKLIDQIFDEDDNNE
jgi:hypothetical protein